jgi:predicted DNA-binding transcriptional regulator AlpA
MSRNIEEPERLTPRVEPVQKRAEELNSSEKLLTEKEMAARLRLSPSWLAKARMRGDGPPYHQFGRAIRYHEGRAKQWMNSRVRRSTSER